MKQRIRTWLVCLIADGVTEANKRQHVEVTVNGRHLVAVIEKERRRRGRSA